ncbi:ArnT family glycosyltransferase [Marinisporobacter balticus]|uniref:Dolichyl-phosphate-mannose-protein mannosyltransferase n=1 Tax=Marinisporobacter balticus TaxID=2018667 RepID=A0A4R2LHF7_9FIRM|nr:glycosyltransferase family 39 protein [Marinisporobacter balticus]TCO78765.1 dolichyl-phosphate-mannose-protein mannosyltransferase [Marinisporobacter balticus]
MRKNINWKKKIGLIYILAIFLIGLYLRIQYIQNVSTHLVFDFKAYQEIAMNIFWRCGHTLGGEPIAFQGMGYPTVLGYVYRFFKSADVMVAKKFNVFCSMLTLIMLYFILIKITKRKFVIYTTYTIAALLPNYIAYNNVVGTEVFFTFLFASIILIQVYDFDRRIKYSLLGIVIGISALTKPFFMAYPVVLAFIDWLKNKEIKKAAILLLVTFMIMACVISPWTYRNYKKIGRLIPISYNSGYVLYINNNGYNTTGAWMPLKDVAAPKEVKQEVADILKKKNVKIAHEIEPIIKKQAKKWILNNPVEFFKLGCLRLQQTFFSGTWDLDAWTSNDMEKIEKAYPKWDKEKQTFYTRNKNFSKVMRDMFVYILNSFGIIYMFISSKVILKALFKKDHKLKYEILIPAINTAFFIAIDFVYEGQTRYNFPLLFLFAMSMSIMIDVVMKAFEDKVKS